MLIQLCVSPNRLFITADADQAVYGSGFNWHDVHADLRFQDRTAIVRTNYRSTRLQKANTLAEKSAPTCRCPSAHRLR